MGIKIDVQDNVLIVMPRDRELQWAAMAIVQKWVNNYETRMGMNDASGGRAQYVLHYSLEMPDEDFAIFQRAGLELVQQPEKITDRLDMVIDLTDERLLTFKDTGKHVVQACGALCGEENIALPLIRRVHPGLGGKWGAFDTGRFGQELVTPEMLHEAVDGEWEGIIGIADWRMYMASAMMIPTIEIVPKNRNKNWLSKFSNLGYRMIQAEEGDDFTVKAESAKESIRALLRGKVCSRDQAQIAV